MRLFIASPVILYDYTALREEISDCLEGKWVPEEQLHLTWIFLGEQPSPQEALRRLASLAPLRESAPLRSLGTFGRPPRILYARSESAELYEKARSFREAGFDLYRFKPHATLCRIKTIYSYKTFKSMMQRYKGEKLGEISEEIGLYRSTLTPQGPIYQKIASVTP